MQKLNPNHSWLLLNQKPNWWLMQSAGPMLISAVQWAFPVGSLLFSPSSSLSVALLLSILLLPFCSIQQFQSGSSYAMCDSALLTREYVFTIYSFHSLFCLLYVIKCTCPKWNYASGNVFTMLTTVDSVSIHNETCMYCAWYRYG